MSASEAAELPEVSIVVPAFNSRRFLADTLRSLRTQTLAALEIIVVDDGSTDGTTAFANQFVAADPRIRVVQQANAGVAAARNTGASLARGEFVAFCDSDDWWDPRFLEKAVKIFRNSGPETGAVYGWTAFHDVLGRRLPFELYSSSEGDVSRELVVQNFIGSGSATVFRRKTYEQVGGFSLRFAAENAQGCEDWEMLIRVARVAHFRVIPELMIHYRRSAGGMSSQRATMARSHALLLKLVAEHWPGLGSADRRAARRNFFLYLCDESIRRGRSWECWRWLWSAWWVDVIGGLRCRTIYKFAGRNVLVMLGLPAKSDTGPQTLTDQE